MQPVNFIQPAAVKAIALSVNVTHLTDEAAKALAPDVEYRLREVIQDALKFARHSKRTKLTTQDINNALRLRNIEPLYGFLGNNDPAKFVRATGHPDVYFVRDSTVPLEQITCAPLPKAPNQTTVMPHWLFIDGVQPQTEENAAVERPPPPPKRPRLAAAVAAAAGGKAAVPGAQADAADRRRDAAGPLSQQQPASGAPGAAADGVAQPGSGAGAAAAGASGQGGAGGGAAAAVQVALPVQHILSDEMQRLLEQIKNVLGPASLPPPPPPVSAAAGDGALWGAVQEGAPGSGALSSSGPSALELTPMQRAVLTTVQSDPGMQQLLPYLTKHVGEEVAQGLRHLARLHMVLKIMQALLLNPHVQLEPYLHQLMPSLLTCCLAKSLGSSPTSEDHWSLRDAAASLVARLCSRFGEPFYSLKVKVSKQLIRVLLDGSKPLTSHYGAVVALAALGHTTVRLLLLPQLDPYLSKLQPALEARKEGVRQYEATRVYGALLSTVGAAMYDKLLGTAADGLLPVHLFRGGRPRRTPIPADGSATTTSTAAPVPAAPIPAILPPPPNPELDAVWASVLATTPSLQDLFNGIASQPTAPRSLEQLVFLRGLAADPNNPNCRAAQALLHQLAKQGVGVEPAATPAPAAAAAVANGSDGGSAATTASRQQGQKQPQTQQQEKKAGGAPGKTPGADSGKEGGASANGNVGSGGEGGGQSPREVLADSWREDADLGEVVWALAELFGPAFLAWLPQPRALTSLTL